MASSVSFGIYFAIAGAVFLDDYKVPAYTFKDWQLLAGVPLGLFAALVVTVLAGFMMGATRLSPVFSAGASPWGWRVCRSRMCEPAMRAKTVMEMSSTAAARASGTR